MTIWWLVLALHILAMAVWTGGMAYALLVLRPSLAVLSPADRMAVQQQTLRRFFLIVWHAMPIVLITGWAMVLGVYGGFAHINWAINAMQGLGLVMAGVFLAMFFGPWRRFRRRSDAAEANRIRRLVTVNLVLGVAVVVLAALGQGTW